MHRRFWLFFVATFLVDPTFACGPGEPEFHYGATEMRAAAEGTWTFVIAPDTGASPLELTVKVEQATQSAGTQARSAGRGLLRRAEACGTRTLVKSANACFDLTQMPLAVTFVSGNEAFAQAKLVGIFDVYGLTFDRAADSSLSFGLGGYSITSQLAPDGTVVRASVEPSGLRGTLVSAGRTNPPAKG